MLTERGLVLLQRNLVPKPGTCGLGPVIRMAKVDGGMHVMRTYRGAEDNLEELWQKFKVVGKIQKWADGKTRMEHLTLYLTGDAFSVWSEMDSTDKRMRTR